MMRSTRGFCPRNRESPGGWRAWAASPWAARAPAPGRRCPPKSAGFDGHRRPLRPRELLQGCARRWLLGETVAPTSNARSGGAPVPPLIRATRRQVDPPRRSYSNGHPALSLQAGHLRSCGKCSKGNLLLASSCSSRRSWPHRAAASPEAAAWISPVGVRLSRVPRLERDRLVRSPSAKARNTSTATSSLMLGGWPGRPAAERQVNRGARSGSHMGSRRCHRDVPAHGS